jgi:hypothetical protein
MDAFSIADLVEGSPLSRSTIYAEIKAGRLKARKIGRRTLVLGEDWRLFLTSLPELSNKQDNAQVSTAQAQNP